MKRAAAVHQDAPGHTKETNEALQKEIVERKNAELEIQHQAAFARFNPNPVLELSATGEINYFNYAAGAMARDLGREAPAQILPPNTAAMVGECLAAGTPKLRVETQIGPRVISWSFFPIKSNNTVHCYAGDITERRQAEEALHRSETKFRTLYDSTSNAKMLLSEKGFFDCNPATLEVFGCASREEFCSKHPADLSPPIQPDGTDSRTLANRQIATALEKGHHQFEWMHKRADTGEVFPSEVLLNAMELDGKRVLLASVQNITKRRQMEARIAEVMKQQQAILEVSPIGISLNKGRVIQWSNPAHCAMVGYTPEELHGMDTSALFVRKEDYERVGREMAVQIPQGLICMVENEFKRKNGTRFWCFAQGRALDLGDLSAGVIWMLIDITERKRAEETLRESEAKLRGVFEGSKDAMGLSLRGAHLFVNPAYLQMFGFENNEQLAGTSILVQIAPSHRQQILHYVERRAAGEKVPTLYETRGVKTNGDEFDMEVRVSTFPLHGEICSLATIRDTTERKQAEMRMRKFSHEIVTARENEKRHLSSVLHHDVGSLAVGISAYLDAIEEDLRSEKPAKALRWMQRTRNLFDQSLKRLKGLAVELRPPELDVLGLDAALRQHFSLVTKRGGIRIRFKKGQHGNRLIGDTAIVLFRVAQEALTNAITHGFAKRVAVDLLTLQKEVRLTIRDDGKGFDSSQQMKLPMSHLGLRVMREMADFVGGAFTIDSSPGKGTTVRLTLPIKTAPAPAPLPPSPRLWRTRRCGKTIRSAVRSARPQKGSRA